MKKICSLLLVALIIILTPKDANPTSSNEKKVNKLFLNFLYKWKIPGASVAFSQNGKVFYSNAFGYATSEEKRLTTINNSFRIASISKMITATAILKLMDEGKISLNSKVFGPDGYLNGAEYIKPIDNRIYDITVKQLLEHTAGWDRDISGDPMFNNEIAAFMQVPSPPSSQSIINFILQKKLDFNPGTRYSYSNIGYCILGRIIEQISGESYEQYVKKRILAPSDIQSMAIGKNLKVEKFENEVCYYDKRLSPSCYADGKTVSCQYGGFNLPVMDSHGGWISTTPDLIKFLALIDGKPDVPDILSDSAIKIMHTPSSVFPGYSLGCQVNSSGNVWHTGNLPGSSSFAAILNNGISWVILLNSSPCSEKYFAELDALMWEAYKLFDNQAI